MVHKRVMFVVLSVMIPSLMLIKMASGHPSDETLDLNSLSDADIQRLTISLERLECFGNCPGYRLTIHGDGHVEYVGIGHVKEIGKKEGRIETSKIRTLMAAFGQATFLSLPDYSEERCTCRVCTDMATAITELSVKGTSHRLKHYYGCGCAPKALFELESAIDKAVNAPQWTGDVRKAGPFGTTCFAPR